MPKKKLSLTTINRLTKLKPKKTNLAEDHHNLKKDRRHMIKDRNHMKIDLHRLIKTNIKIKTLTNHQIALKSLIIKNRLTKMILKKIKLIEDLHHLKKDRHHLIKINIRTETLINHQIALKSLIIIGMISIRKRIFSKTSHMPNLANHKKMKRKTSIDPTLANLNIMITKVIIKKYIIIVIMREATKGIVHRFKRKSSKEELSKMIIVFLEKIKWETTNKVLNNIKM